MNDVKIGLRKVGKKGAGLCVMLPAIWVKNAEVRVGDSLEVKMRGVELIIEPEVNGK